MWGKMCSGRNRRLAMMIEEIKIRMKTLLTRARIG